MKYFPILIVLYITACFNYERNNISDPGYEGDESKLPPSNPSLVYSKLGVDPQITLSWKGSDAAVEYSFDNSGFWQSIGTRPSPVVFGRTLGENISGGLVKFRLTANAKTLTMSNDFDFYNVFFDNFENGTVAAAWSSSPALNPQIQTGKLVLSPVFGSQWVSFPPMNSNTKIEWKTKYSTSINGADLCYRLCDASGSGVRFKLSGSTITNTLYFVYDFTALASTINMSSFAPLTEKIVTAVYTVGAGSVKYGELTADTEHFAMNGGPAPSSISRIELQNTTGSAATMKIEWVGVRTIP